MRSGEVIINSVFGKAFGRMHSKKIIAQSKIWNKAHPEGGKCATLLLSYDIDDDRDIEMIPKLLNLLKKYDIKAGFAAIGILVKKYPDIFKELINQGHELINHTETHPNSVELGNPEHFDKVSARQRSSEISQCHETVKRILKYNMAGFRIPHFGNQFTDDIYPMLRKLRYSYSSSTVAIRTKTAGSPFIIKGVWELPLTCCPVHPYCIFDTSHAFRSRFARHTAGNYIKTFKDYLRFAVKNRLFVNLYHDPQDIEMLDYEQILKSLSRYKDKIHLTTYRRFVNDLDGKNN